MMNQLRRFIAMPISRKLLFGQAWLLLIYCQICVNHLPLARLMKAFNLRITAPSEQPVVVPFIADIGEIEWAVTTAARHVSFPRIYCLAQALTARILLRRKAIRCRLLLGATFAGASELKAHAWLKTDTGQLLNCGCVTTNFVNLTEFV